MGPKPSSGGPSGPAASKRSKGAAASSGRSDAFHQRMTRIHAARNIPAQPADAALKDGELDLQAFLAAHEFEIRSLEQSMATSKAVSSTRAFQQVPRSLRRRTASHNPKRVPRRLRSRAKKEMQEDNTPTVEARRRKPRTTRARIRAETAKRLGILAARKRRKLLAKAKTALKEGKEAPSEVQQIAKRLPRPKIRRNELNQPPKPPALFRRRQINKTWLPTHKWHAKRARMTEPKNPLWRFAVPLTPTEKIYRPTHRAQGERGTMVWDMSYMSTIGLYGNPAGIEKTLRSVGVTDDSGCWDDRGKKWRTGTRAWTGTLTRERDGHARPMCPVTIVWNPELSESVGEAKTTQKKRQLYLRLSPAAFLEVFTELVRLCKMKGSGVYVEDLRFEVGSIELTGPASTETLLSVITPYSSKEVPKNKHANIFGSLKGLTNPASLPANAVLGFPIQDPRLRYPPRKMELANTAGAEDKLLELIAEWPAEEGLGPHGLFDRGVRRQAACLPSQKAINKKRSRVGPGSFLKPAPAVDPPIPIILIASRSPTSLQAQGTWTLLMPWSCILPIWYSIVHCPLLSGINPRFGGLNETMQVAFERGLPWFPADFIGTDAGAEWELSQRQKRQRLYERRPKSKRILWSVLDLGAGRKGEVGDGLACDFELLFGLPVPAKSAPAEPELVQADKSDDEEAMDVDRPKSPTIKSVDAPSLTRLNLVSRAEFGKMSASSPDECAATPPNTIVNVRLKLLSRGAVSTCARIYRLPTMPNPTPASSDAEVPATLPPDCQTTNLPHDLRAQWLAQVPSACHASSRRSRGHKNAPATDMESRKRRLAQELTAPPTPYPPAAPNQVDIGGHPLVPDAADLIGFVTSGSYCLRDGKSAAIGSIAVEKILPGMRTNRQEGRLCIVRNAGENVGWIARWETV